MNMEEIYRWYLENGEFDDELIKQVQLECFNKRMEPVAKITYEQLQQLLQSDARFNAQKFAMVWWWIFDLEYAVIDEVIARQIIEELKGIGNVWTAVAIMQAVTGLNCAFICSGYRLKDGEPDTSDEIYAFGVIVRFADGSGRIGFLVFDEDMNEVRENDAIFGFLVFD